MVQVIQKNSQQNTEKEILTDDLLRKMRALSEENQASQTASNFNLPYVDLNIMPVNADDAGLFPLADTTRFSMGIFLRRGRNIRVGAVKPDNAEMLEYLKKAEDEKGWNISLFVISPSSLAKIIHSYDKRSLLDGIDQLRLDLTGEDLEQFEARFGDILTLKERMNELPTTEVVSLIFAGALKLEASDIHFEPEEKGVRLRYRIDGVLQDVGTLTKNVYNLILSRVKILGKMKLNIRNTSQDGHFNINVNKKGELNEKERIDIRVNIIPGKFGESIVMRLLNQSDVLLNVEQLGLRGLALEELQKQLAKPNGMILNTGPTGSGKTTTLYAILNTLNDPGTKIITIEDPIEYEIVGISQTQVSVKNNYTFSNGLRSIVRQDPDIILVGEIRDDETADIALNAALTGHLVLSTLHTNDASSSPARLIELGLKPSLIPAGINAFIAQRLVRKLCSHCKDEYEPAKETAEAFQRVLSIISPKAKVGIPKEIVRLYRPRGCKYCNNTGYKGRVGIFEILILNEEIRSLIENMETPHTITKAALENGMITMAQDGMLKAIEGTTSMEEVWRVAGQVDFLETIYDELMDQTLGRNLRVSREYSKSIKDSAMSKETFAKYISSLDPENIAEAVFAGAVLYKAGDIHIEPNESEAKVRLRIDGILQEVASIPLPQYPMVLGKIKNLSGLKTEVRSGAADSRFSIIFEDPDESTADEKIDIRVSIILSGYGETTVLRLLNQAAVALEINSLGIRKENLEKILKEVRKPNGIFLNTGPTGSGKTTTLYSLIKILNTPEVKIMTVEDPIEYRVEGVLQTQVNEQEKYGFSDALRSLLRQNPDIILVGEIRDEETASIALQSSLTGHLVLSTLHTNDATSSIQRLLNMQIRPDDLATAANAFMAQRLVRKLCACKQVCDMTVEQHALTQRVLSTISSQCGVAIPTNISTIYAPGKCSLCHGIGYQGRTVISEVLTIDRDIEALINQHALVSEIEDRAVANGMLTMKQDGILKVLEGETTFEEVSRAVDLF